MPSEKLTRILRSKSSFSFAEIEQMSEDDGWAWVYANAKGAKTRSPSICFTGFSAQEKSELSALAVERGLKILPKVSMYLTMLCCGAEPGPSKTKAAIASGIPILSRSQFELFLETGELPTSGPA